MQPEPAAEPRFLPPETVPPRERERPNMVVRFFTRRMFVTVTTEPIPEARSLQWCLAWAAIVVVPVTFLAGLGLQKLPGLLTLALLALQLIVVAYLMVLLGFEEKRFPVLPKRTAPESYLAALTTVAAATVSGVALLMTALAGLAHWAGQKLDLSEGFLLLVVLGLCILVGVTTGGTRVVSRLNAKFGLHSGEKMVLLFESIVMIAVCFIVLLAW